MASSSSSSPEIHGVPSDGHFSYKYATHEEVLEDLSSRFILNLPEDELSSLERICFQVEQAHWFYEDFIREENPKFPSLPLKKFSAMLFHACPLLRQWSHDHEQAFDNFMQYKTRVPVCGAIMLNDTWEKCLLVKGWKSSSGWGFPKGKINEVEPPVNCAIREVLEETGYNLVGKIKTEDVIEMTIKEQKISLFIVPGVPEEYPFKTKTRKEISRIEWFRLTDLPTWKRNRTAAGRFYLISPFIGPLKMFIHEKRPRSTHKRIPKARRSLNLQAQKQLTCNTQVAQCLQSSSTDNGEMEPPTPSPLNPESPGFLITDVSNGLPVSDDSTISMDHHFARLLSGLSVSASHNANVVKPAVNVLENKEVGEPIDQPISQSKRKSSQVLHVPAAPAESPGASVESKIQSVYLTQPTDTFPVRLSHTPVARVDGNFFESSKVPQLSKKGLISRRPSVSTAKTSWQNKPLRSPSNPDISPYLSRTPACLVPSADRMKHVALLEAASAESARLMNAYKSAAAEGRPIDVNDNFKHSAIPPSPVSSLLTSLADVSHGSTAISNSLTAQPRNINVLTQGLSPRNHQVDTPTWGLDPLLLRSKTSLACHTIGGGLFPVAHSSKNGLSKLTSASLQSSQTPIPRFPDFPVPNYRQSSAIQPSSRSPSSSTLLSILQSNFGTNHSTSSNIPSSHCRIFDSSRG